MNSWQKLMGVALFSASQIALGASTLSSQGTDRFERINQDTQANINTSLDQWVAMWNSADLNSVDKLFCTQSTYLSSEKDGLISGKDALRQHHAAFGFVPGGKTTTNKLWLDEVKTQKQGPATIVTAVWNFQNKPENKTQRGPVTFVYVKDGGSYRIAHAHFANAMPQAQARTNSDIPNQNM